MAIKINAIENDFVRTGRACPHCFRGITPDVLSVNTLEELTSPDFDDSAEIKVATLQCPTCKKPFIKYFGKTYLPDKQRHSFHELNLLFSKRIKLDIPKNIIDLSPSFKDIYEQTLLAKEYNLTHLLGAGYRKSIEFLLKDFAIKLHPDRMDKYLKMSINQVINEIFADKVRLLTASKGVIYLGNDFTHYNDKNLDKDITDMENFIKLLLNEINSELTYLELHDFVNPS